MLQPDGDLLKLASNTKLPEVAVLAVQCLESCICTLNYNDKVNRSYFTTCFEIFIHHLVSEKPLEFESLLHCKVR